MSDLQRRIYVASSWRNPFLSEVISELRRVGHQVYDFRNPRPGSQVDPRWQKWDPHAVRAVLSAPIVEVAFQSDYEALTSADTGVLVLPCGRSAHLEAGYFAGEGKELFVLLDDHQEPELMYKLATGLALSLSELVEMLSYVGGRYG